MGGGGVREEHYKRRKREREKEYRLLPSLFLLSIPLLTILSIAETICPKIKTTTITAKGNPKVRSEATSYGADDPTFMKLYCASLTGLLIQSFVWHDADGRVVDMDSADELASIKRRVINAWNAAVLATQELEMQQLNASVEHES